MSRETKRSRGRPPGSTIDNPRDVTKRQRWTAGEWEQIESAAEREGVTPSVFIRRAALDAAGAGG